MKLYTLKNGSVTVSEELNVNFTLTCDLLCVGAGAAGCYAADSAAREGCNVILLEISTCVGGMHVRGNVCSYYYGDVGGKYLETDEACNRDVFLAGNQQPETKQTLIYRMLKKSGVRVLCNHSPIGVYVEDDRVVGLLVLSDSGIISIGAKAVVDSTSDGHIIRMLPVKKTYGRSSDGKTVPFTVRTQYFSNGCFMSINTDSGYCNQYDCCDFSKKTVLAHANGTNYFDKGDFINVAYITGIREGLCFEGEDALRYEDLIFNNPCERPLFYAYSDLDKHGLDMAMDEELFQNWFVISNLATVTTPIPVPMGCIVPKGIKGIVTAGRCVSGDTYSVSAVRMNRDMFRMGECVGIAASMAINSGCDILDIDYDLYLTKVKSRGCFKSDRRSGFGFDNAHPSLQHLYAPVTFDAEKNLDLLSTTAPGVAIWSCFISKNRSEIAQKVFYRLTSAEGELEQYNCAIALGIMGDVRALPTLRKIVINRDSFRFTDCRRSNQLRTSIAICLLGRIGEKADAALLDEIVFGEKEFFNPIYSQLTTNIYGTYNPVYFDVFTHASMALIKLYKAHKMPLAPLNKRFAQLFDNNTVVRRVTSAPYGTPDHAEICDFQSYVLKITS